MIVKETHGIKPEIIAAISVGMALMGKAQVPAEKQVKVNHSVGGCIALRIKRTSTAWTNVGRQKIMNNRL